MKSNLTPFFLLGVLALLLPGCATVNDYGRISREQGDAMMAQRRAEIAAEPRGDHFIGRRYVLERLRIWGYIRRPGEPWTEAKFVIMNEDRVRLPDRLPEFGGAPRWGFDHNYQYKVFGRFTGRKVYDPNADAEVAEFMPTRFELLDKDPGFLYKPGEVYDTSKYLRP